MKSLFQITTLLLSGLILTGCDSGVFDEGAAQGVVEAAKIPLNGEEVLLTPDQVICGEKKGLWTVDQIDGGGAIGRLTAAARALEFGDDVRMGEHKFSGPYVQLHGNFNVKIEKVNKMTDENADVKILDAKMGAVITHECFDKPLPLLGIYRGDFSEENAPRIRLRQHNGWTADQILH